MTEQASTPVVLEEVRLLEGPNLYFTRPAAKLTLSVPGLITADPQLLQTISSGLGFRPGDAKAAGSPPRTSYAVRLVERVMRAIAREAGTVRLGVRVRTGVTPYEMVVAFPLRGRGRARPLAEALVTALTRLLGGDDPKTVVSHVGSQLASVPIGEPIRPLRPKIPVVAITGTNGKTTTTRLIAHLAMTAGLRTGWSSTDGVLVQGELIEHGDYSGPGGARAVLAADGVEFAALETARGGMLLRGLGVAATDVSLVTNVSADHLGQNGIETVDQLAEVKAIITRCVKPNGWAVLNGEDPRVWAMRNVTSGRTWCFAIDPASPALRESLDSRGRGITVLDGAIAVLVPGREPDVLLPVVDVPMTLAGLSEHNLANALAGAAAGLGAGLPREAVIEGLRTFEHDPAHNPGRMNIYTVPLPTGGEATFIIDMAHNEGGLEALLRVARGLRQPGAQVLLGLGTGGDRTDEILRNLGEMAALQADQVQIEHKEHYLRGRTMEDLEARLREGMSRAGATPTASWPTELDGLHGLLAAARDGDVIAEMVHSDRALLHDYLLSIGGRPDDAAAIRRKVVGARGEHEAEARIVAVRAITDPVDRVNAAQALLESFPGDPRITFEVAEAYDVAGQPDSAIARYDESLAAGLREPFRRRARLQRAASLRVLGRTDEAISELDSLAAEWPDNQAVATFRALAYHDGGRDTAALRDVLAGVLAHSTDPEIDHYRTRLASYISAM